MKNLRKALFIAAGGVLLYGCTGERAPSASDQEVLAEKDAELLTQSEGPNFCHGEDYNPEDPFRFVKFDFKIPQEEMSRIRADLKTELEASRDLPQADQAAAIEPYLVKTEILSDLSVQSLEDQIVPAAAALCNFDRFEKDKCKGTSSRSIRKAEMVAGTLSYRAKGGRDIQFFISSPDFGDVSIDAGQGASTWSRAPDGVEGYRFKDSVSEISWTEKPDCSGQLSKRRNAVSYEVTWASPETQPMKMTFEHCRGQACISGRF